MALLKARCLWPKRRGADDRDDARIDLVATEVVEQMELYGMWCVQIGMAGKRLRYQASVS